MQGVPAIPQGPRPPGLGCVALFFVLRKIARIWLPTARYIEIDVQSSIDAIKKDLLSNGLAGTFSGLTTKGASANVP